MKKLVFQNRVPIHTNSRRPICFSLGDFEVDKMMVLMLDRKKHRHSSVWDSLSRIDILLTSGYIYS